MRLVLIVLSLLVFVKGGFGLPTLVLVDDLETKNSHSQLFAALTARGIDLEFRTVDDDRVQLAQYGELYYENAMILAYRRPDYLWEISSSDLVEFYEAGGNVFVAVEDSVPETIKNFAVECHVDFDADKTTVFDFFHSSAEHKAIYSRQWLQNSAVTGISSQNEPVLFKGKSMAIGEDSDLVFEILTGESTSFCAKDSPYIGSTLENAGKDVVLVAALQSKSNVRATFSGSLSMLSDVFFDASISESISKTSNRVFAESIVLWTFGKRGVLRAGEVVHFHQGANVSSWNPESYRIGDNIEYRVRIEQLLNNVWIPYQADNVQLELVMLDPYIRENLEHDGQGNFFLKLKVPDVFGVYKFQINHYRKGFSDLHVKNVIPLRPFRHDEYERFIVAAYPYYASAFSMMAGFFIFSIAYLTTQ